MLDLYIDDQPVAYKIIKNAIKNNKLNHAYLLETNGYSRGLDFALAFSKLILCPYSYTNNNNCNGCSQCQMIDEGNFIEIKIINPDGQWIKKEQMEELQNIFSKKAIIGNKKVYIINGADKLNISSANSILKFIEEPSEGIIAILLSENANQVLSTIVSRCQTLSLIKEKKEIEEKETYKRLANYSHNNQEEINLFKEDENNKDKINMIVDYIEYYEKNKLRTIIFKNKEIIETFNDKNSLFQFYQWIMLYYKDILNYKLNKKLDYYDEYIKKIEIISEQNTIESICEKLKIIVKLSETIKFNANAGMLMDKLIIELSEV